MKGVECMKTSLFKNVCASFAGLCIVIQSGIFVNASSKATVFIEDEEISYWAPCTDILKVVTDAGEDAEISLYDLSSSLLYDSESECVIEAIAENDGYTVELSENLVEGHKYKLVVDDKQISFKATTTGGMVEISDRIDFSGITDADLNNATDAKPEKDTYVIGSEGLLITKVAKETRISVKAEQNFSGGKGLQFVGRGTLDKEIIPDSSIKEGKIRIDARVKVVNGSFEMSMGNSDGALIPILAISPDSAEISYQNTATTSGIMTKEIASPIDGYAEISYEMNLDDSTVVYTINGEEGTLEAGKMPYYNSKGSILAKGVGFIQLEGSPSAGEYILDYLTTTTYEDALDVEKITLIDVEGNPLKTEKDETVSPEIEEIKIKFNGDVDGGLLSCIEVLDVYGEEIETQGEYDKNTRTYTITLPQYLSQFGEFTINIPKEEIGLVYEYSETFKTGEGIVGIADFKITDKTGNAVYSVSDITDGVTVNLEILNTKLTEGKMTIVYTESNDKLMTNMLCKEVEISKDKRKIECSLEVDIDDVSQINEIKAFVWNNVKEHIPQYKAIVLY